MTTGASATSLIRITPGKANAIALTAKRAALHPGKQLMSLQLTSGSGERTPYEVAFRLNKVEWNLTLPTCRHYITGISKPVDTMKVN